MSKIVHFGKYYSPDVGGIESVTAAAANGAATAGHQVSVVCFSKRGAYSPEVAGRVRVFRAPALWSVASQPLGLSYVRHCLREASEADLVHMHAPNMLGAICCLLIPRKIPVLVHWHSDVLNKGLLGVVVRPLERALLKRATRIISTSRAYAHHSKVLSRHLDKVEIVPIGVSDPGVVVRPASSLPQDLGAALRGRKVVLAVGRLVPYKGFEVLIEAAPLIDESAAIVIVGHGPQRDRLAQLIRDRNLSDRVYLAGGISDQELHGLFNSAAVFCLPSTYRAEAFGVVLVEAMSYGLPVVATEIPGSGVPWVNMHNVSGLNVPVNDPSALATACNLMVRSPIEAARLSKGARRRYEEHFTVASSVKAILLTYASILGGMQKEA